LESFEELYQNHYQALHRIAQKMMCHDAANDIVQDVFIDFFQKTKNGVQIKHPKSYLYRGTLNKCIDEQRRTQKFADRQIDKETTDGRFDYEKQETRECIRHCLSNLETRDRELTLLYSEGLSYKEMSEITQIPLTSIGKTLARALKKLEKELKVKGYELP